jgi:hypothetical protein
MLLRRFPKSGGRHWKDKGYEQYQQPHSTTQMNPNVQSTNKKGHPSRQQSGESQAGRRRQDSLRNQAFSQACVVCSQKSGSVSERAIFRQVRGDFHG